MLWSLKLVRHGVTRGFGSQLRQFLSISTKNRLLAALAGGCVTMFLQSSLATILLVSSFAGQAMLSTSAGLALALGADVGTTLVAQILTFDLSWLSPTVLLIGVVCSSFKGKPKNIGRILIGLGLILLSLDWIAESSLPMKNSETLPLILKPLANDAILAILVSALITWLAHSSLAIVLLLVSLTASGVLPVELGFVMVLGANLGGTVAPLISSLGGGPAAVRVPIANMAMRFVGVIAVLPFIDLIQPHVANLSEDYARQIVNFHMVFNIALAIVFLPLTGIVGSIVTKILPDRIDLDDPAQPKYLNLSEVETPVVALASAERETLRMADTLEHMMADTIQAFKISDESFVYKIKEKDDIIDGLYNEIKHYMARLSQEPMDEKEGQRYIEVLTFATNLEHAGDIVDKSLMPMALKKIRNSGRFSTEGFREIENIHERVMNSIRMAQNIFVSGDVGLARQLLKDKELIRQSEIEASTNHIDRLSEGVPETIATTSLHLDIIRDFRRINSYMCTVSYPILERKGQIRSSRLRSEDKKG